MRGTRAITHMKRAHRRGHTSTRFPTRTGPGTVRSGPTASTGDGDGTRTGSRGVARVPEDLGRLFRVPGGRVGPGDLDHGQPGAASDRAPLQRLSARRVRTDVRCRGGHAHGV